MGWFRALPGNVVVYDIAGIVLVLKGGQVVEAWQAKNFYERYPFLATTDGWSPLRPGDIDNIDWMHFLRSSLNDELVCIKTDD